MNQEPNLNWLSIGEASKLKKKSKSTIWRLIKRTLEGPNKERIKVEAVESKGFRKNFRYLIERSFLLDEAIDTTSEPNLKPSEAISEAIREAILKPSEAIIKGKDELISLLKQRLYLGDKDKKAKDYQIAMLGKKFDNFLERQRETNLLLAQLQNKVKLLEEPKKKWWRK